MRIVMSKRARRDVQPRFLAYGPARIFSSGNCVIRHTLLHTSANRGPRGTALEDEMLRTPWRASARPPREAHDVCLRGNPDVVFDLLHPRCRPGDTLSLLTLGP